MNNQPILFERIIHRDLRPWLDENRYQDRVAPNISDLIQIVPRFQPLYEIEFCQFFNSRTRYYHKLITNEANNYCNHVIELINSNEDKCLLGDTLKTELRTLLKDIAKLIKANDWELRYINPYKSSFNIDIDHKTNTYIIQLLKTATIKVYLEIQEAFKSFISGDDYMEFEVLYLQYLSELIPEQTFLTRVRKVIDDTPVEAKTIVTKINRLCRPKPKSFTCHKLIKDAAILKDLLDFLINYFLIDHETNIYDLRKIFSGKDNYKPIVWTGNISHLYYFIVLIHNEYKCVENISPYHWQVTCNCFIKPDGTTFDSVHLKSQKKPKQNVFIIEKAASWLN